MKAQILFLLSIFILACGGLSNQQQEAFDNLVEQLADQYLTGVEVYVNAEKDVQKWRDRKDILLEMPEYHDTTSFAFRYVEAFNEYTDRIETTFNDMKQILKKGYEGVEYQAVMKSLKGDVFRLQELAKKIKSNQLFGNTALKASYSRIGDQPPSNK